MGRRERGKKGGKGLGVFRKQGEGENKMPLQVFTSLLLDLLVTINSYSALVEVSEKANGSLCRMQERY